MRIAVTHAYSWPEVRRGAERMVPELAAALASRGHEVTVFTTGSAVGMHREGGVRTVRWARRRDEGDAHERDFARHLIRPLSTGRFDAVHSLGPRDAFASVVRTRRDFRREAPLEAWVWRAVVNASRKKRGRYAREAQMHPTAPSANGSAPHDERAELAAPCLAEILLHRGDGGASCDDFFQAGGEGVRRLVARAAAHAGRCMHVESHRDRGLDRASDRSQRFRKILRGERPSLAIEITRECPLRCPGCYARTKRRI